MIAANIMTTNLLCLHEDAMVEDAVSLFREMLIYCHPGKNQRFLSKSPVPELPIIDSAEKPVGEVGSRSILHRAVPAYASSDLLGVIPARDVIRRFSEQLRN
jgi:CBS domain-containing protein